MLSFENTEIAFQSRSTRDLNRAFFLFNMVKHPWIVKTGKIITEFALNIGLPINGIIKKTVFNHFCGGETITDCKSTIDELHQFGIGTILDYSVEAKANEADFESCLEQTLSAIAMAKENPDSIPFCVFKPTGLGPFSLWEKFSTDLEKSPEEQKAFQKVCTRVNTICKAAYNAHTPILIDAEESWIQLAVDRISDEMMQAYNTDRAIVYNTVQLYRHGRLAYLKDSIEKAKTKGYYYGVKTVRGAYMEKERERAIRLNYNSPIQATKEDSDKDYNASITTCIENLDAVFLCAGTHNEESARSLYQLLIDHKVSLNDPRIFFAQLYGMSDHISFNLSKKGCNVAKYVPYGPVKDVMPYLFRRAEENTSVAGQTGRELSLLIKEKRRRKTV